MSELFNTLYARLLMAKQQQHQEQLLREKQKREDDQTLQKNLLASAEVAEKQRQGEFERKYKLAELQGKYAGALGQQMPTNYQDPSVAEYARTGYAGGQWEARKGSHDNQLELEKFLYRQQHDADVMASTEANRARLDANADESRSINAFLRKTTIDEAVQKNQDIRFDKLNKSLTPFTQAADAIRQIGSTTDQKDVPGVGLMDRAKIKMGLGDEVGVNNRVAAANLFNAYLAAVSGKQVTSSEQERSEIETMLNSPFQKNFRIGFARLARIMKAGAKNAQATLRPGDAEIWESRHGRLADSIPDVDDNGRVIIGQQPSIRQGAQPAAPQQKRTTRTDPETGETREWNGSSWVPVR